MDAAAREQVALHTSAIGWGGDGERIGGAVGKRGDKIIGWKSLADEFGVNERTLKTWFRISGLRLARLGRGKRSPVFMVIGQLYRCVQMGVKAALEHARTP